MQLSNVEKTATEGTSFREQKAVNYLLKGVNASSGVARGRCIIVRSSEDLDRLGNGAVAVCETASVDLIPFIPGLAGLAIEVGTLSASVLHHAREWGIPAVVGVKDLMEGVHEGDSIWVDGEYVIVYSMNS
jgi:pyruvate,water dikinase